MNKMINENVNYTMYVDGNTAKDGICYKKMSAEISREFEQFKSLRHDKILEDMN